MKVKELKEILKNCNDNDIVCVEHFFENLGRREPTELWFRYKEEYKNDTLVVFRI